MICYTYNIYIKADNTAEAHGFSLKPFLSQDSVKTTDSG